ncbi:dioxygenase family protein [Variovorax sp. LARHSF232]
MAATQQAMLAPIMQASPRRTNPRGLPRRSVTAALIGFPALWTGLARAQAPAARRLTPAQTEGPFYPAKLPADSDNDLLRNGALRYGAGEAAWVEGTVTDLDGKPLAGAAVEIWQCDQAGHYHHPGDGDRADRAFQGFGRVMVDAQGRWRFRTIRPVPYTGRTPHIHVKVKLGPRELLTTQLYVQGAPGNGRDFLWRSLSEEDRAALTRPFERSADGWNTRFPIVVAA